MFVIFSAFLMVDQIFRLPQLKLSVIVSNKLVYMSCLTSLSRISCDWLSLETVFCF